MAVVDDRRDEAMRESMDAVAGAAAEVSGGAKAGQRIRFEPGWVPARGAAASARMVRAARRQCPGVPEQSGGVGRPGRGLHGGRNGRSAKRGCKGDEFGPVGAAK